MIENVRIIGDKLAERIDEYCQVEYASSPSRRLGFSKLSNECGRAIWYGFRWAHAGVIIGRIQRLFQRGIREEPAVYNYLRAIGCEIKEIDPATNFQWGVFDYEGHGAGFLDGLLKLPPDFGYEKDILLEIKTHSTRSFSNLLRDGLQIAKPEHYGQMSVYGYKMNIDYGLYFAVNKNDDDIWLHLFKINKTYGEELIVKGSDIINSQSAPAKLSETPTFYKCKMCDFSPICHFNKPLAKNCRSCSKAEPIPNGEWACNWNNEGTRFTIPKDAIKDGCDAWNPIA